jgi:hypothetical protein
MNRKKSKLISKPDDTAAIRRVAISMQESEFLLIKANAKAAAMPFSAYVRHMTLEGKVKACLSEEDRALFRELVAMSNDLHQLWKMARDQGVVYAIGYFEAGRDAVDKVLNLLNHDRQKLSTRKVLPASEQVSSSGSDKGRDTLPGRGEGTRLPVDGPGFRDDPSIASREDPPGLSFGAGFSP